MKRNFVTTVAIFLILLLMVSLAACGGGPNTPDGKADSWKDRPKTEAILAGKIAEIYEDSFLLVGTEPFDLYMISAGLDIYDPENQPAGEEYLKEGQRVEIGYSGLILESYPAQLGTPVYVKVNGREDDMVGFYQTVLDDLWAVDPGLNPETGVLAFDLTGVENLSEAEKSALVYTVAREHGLEGIAGTFDELGEQGYINREELYFEKGMLFSFELSDVTEDSFTFNVKKWRSGTGAFFFQDCKAVKKGGVWSYTVGYEMIS